MVASRDQSTSGECARKAPPGNPSMWSEEEMQILSEARQWREETDTELIEPARRPSLITPEQKFAAAVAAGEDSPLAQAFDLNDSIDTIYF